MVKNKRRRKHASANNKADNGTNCPWWWSNNDSHENNIYGLYEFIKWSNVNAEQITEIDLSFWPINDHDILHLQKMMSEVSLAKHDESQSRKGIKSSHPARLRYIQKLNFHSCTYLTDFGINILANDWKFRGREMLPNMEDYDNMRSDNNESKYGNKDIFEKSMKRTENNTPNLKQRFPPLVASSISVQYLNLPLLHLDLSSCPKVTNHACKVIGKNFKKLQVLNLSDCMKITDVGVICIMKGCKYLQELHLKNLVQVKDEGLHYVRENLVLMKLLRIIDIDGCVGLSNEAIIHLLESDTTGSIYQINLSNCIQIELGMIGFCRHSISNSVKSIELRNIPHLSDSIMGWIASGCKNLQKIDLSGCNIMHEVTLGYLFEGCKRLKVVKLNKCRGLSDNAMNAIDEETGKHLEDLEMIGCRKLSNLSISRIARLCPNLKRLNLRGVPMISNETVIALARSCPLLEYLDLSAQMSSSQPCTDSQTPRVGSEGITALGRSCQYLHTLLCDGCTRVNDDCIVSIAKGCNKLKKLSLRLCYRITNSSLFAIGQHCSLLEQIFLCSCKHVDDRGIMELSNGCPQLVLVNLMGVSQVTDNGVLHIAINCPQLQNLNIRDCYRLTDRSLLGLAAFCPSLEDIDMFSVDNISNKAISGLNESCPSIRYLNVGGSEISDYHLQNLASKFYYCLKVKGKLLLEPLYQSKKIHQQHIQVRQKQEEIKGTMISLLLLINPSILKFMNFLLYHQKVLFCAMKAFFLEKRIRNRRYLNIQCQRIQSSYRNYRNRCLLEAVAKLIEDERRNKAQKVKSVTIIIAFFRFTCQRLSYLAIRSACFVIQNFFKRVLVRLKEVKRDNIDSSKSFATLVCDSMESKVKEIEATSDNSLGCHNLLDEDAVYNYSQAWEILVSRQLQKEAHCQEDSAANVLQCFWRNKVSIRQQKERSNLIHRKCKRWFVSLVREIHTRNATRFRAALTIQQYFRRRQQHNTMLQLKIQEQKTKEERENAALKIAMWFQSHWRMKQGLKICEMLRQIQCTQKIATIKIQSWWRCLQCIFLRQHKTFILKKWKRLTDHKISIFNRWKRLVDLKILKLKHIAATLIQTRFRYRRKREAYHKASYTLQVLLPILLSKRRLKQVSLLRKQNVAACMIQKYVRRMITKNMIQSQKVAVIKLQNLWRSYSSRQAFKKICIHKMRLLQGTEKGKKKELKETRRLKLILALFQRTEVKAAIIIQTRCRAFLVALHEEEELRKRQEEEQRKQEIEEERRQAFKAFHDHKYNIKGIAKQYLDGAVLFFSDMKNGKTRMNGTKDALQHFFKDRSDKQNLTKEMIKYSILKARGVTQKNKVIETFHKSLREHFAGYRWFDKRCEKVIYSYAMWPDEIMKLNRIWSDNLDFRNEGRIWVNDFFDFVEEKKSSYGTFLFHAINASPDRDIIFSEYLHVITFFSLLGKLDIIKFVFKLKCKDSAKYLVKNDWDCLLNIMLSNEKIQYPRHGALQAFDKHASTDVHGTKILFFEDFQRILNEYPFVIVPILRLQMKTRQSHLGENFWYKKRKDLHETKSSIEIKL